MAMVAGCGNCGGIYLAFAAVDNETIANVVLCCQILLLYTRRR